MRHLVLLLALFLGMAVYQLSTVDLPTQPLPPVLQQPDPLPQIEHRDDKYKDDAKAYCFYGKPETAMPGNPSAHPCQCVLMCHYDPVTGEGEQAENSSCALFCSRQRCLCHTEEPCPDCDEAKP